MISIEDHNNKLTWEIGEFMKHFLPFLFSMIKRSKRQETSLLYFFCTFWQSRIYYVWIIKQGSTLDVTITINEIVNLWHDRRTMMMMTITLVMRTWIWLCSALLRVYCVLRIWHYDKKIFYIRLRCGFVYLLVYWCVCFLKRFMKLPIILKCREILMFCIWLTFRIIVERLIGRVVAQLDVVNVPSVTYARLSALLALLYGYIQLYNCVSVVIVKNDGSWKKEGV